MFVRASLLCSSLVLLCACGGPKQNPCTAGQVPVRTPDVKDPAAGFHLYSHAHNDYEHTHPLQDALDNRIYSVEADIYWGNGDFPVSHEGIILKGKLKDLYLDPLQARVAANGGSVYGDGVPFTLTIDLKENQAALPQALHDLFAQYPMFTQYSASGDTQGAVNVILTGESKMKTALVELTPRNDARDSNDFSPADPVNTDNKWVAYAVSWPDFFSWNGSGTIPAAEEQSLLCLVENANARHRSVRIYGGPDTVETWQTELNAGVRFINTDKLPELNAFLETAQTPSP